MASFELFDEVYTLACDGRVTFGLYTTEYPDGSIGVVSHPRGQLERISAKEKERIRISDRYFHPGEFVTDRNNRLGYVLTVEMLPALQILDTGIVVSGVDSKRLERVQGYRPGDIILYANNWIGEVTKVKRSVKLQVEEGKWQRIVDWSALAECIDEIEDGFSREDVFYPGLRMKNRCWKSSELTAEKEFEESYVDEVWVDELEVLWLNSIEHCPTGQDEPKQRLIGTEEISGLDRLRPYDNLAIQLGSIRLMRFKEDDVLTTLHSWLYNPFGGIQTPREPLPSIPKTHEGLTPVEVIHTKTNVTVIWTDTLEREVIPGVELRKHFVSLNLPFYPTGFVQNEDKPSSVIQVLFSMDLNECVGQVGCCNEKLSRISSDIIENVSLYNLTSHPEMQFRPGTIVTNMNVDDKSSYTIGYVLYFEPKTFKVKIRTASTEGFLPLNCLKPLALRYPRTTSTKCKNLVSRKNILYKDVEMLDNNQLNLVGWTSANLKCLDRAFINSKMMTLCSQVPTNHAFGHLPPILTNSLSLKERMAYEFLLLTPMASFVRIKAFFERMYDLYSVMIMQSKEMRSPYYNFVYLFDLYIPPNYPAEPPQFKHFSLTPAIFSPFISEDGSLEIPILKRRFWSSNFTLAKIIHMIREIVLVKLPALLPEVDDGDLELDNLMETVETLMNSPAIPQEACRYNEALFITLLTHTEDLIRNPYLIWHAEILHHFSKDSQAKFFDEMLLWLTDYEDAKSKGVEDQLGSPFYISPLSDGGSIAIRNRIDKIKSIIFYSK